MATGKRYYWIKLRDTFLTSDTIDFFMSQPEGANYVVLYQALCLKTINTDGRLERVIGEVVIPYDVDKIQRDCKWFSADTIRIALGLYKKFGLIYEDQNGTLVLTNHAEMVGSETTWAAQKRNQNQKRIEGGDQGGNLGGNLVESEVENFHPEIRDKRLDTRDQILDKDTRVVGVGESPATAAEAQTLESFAANNLSGFNAVCFEEFGEYMKDFPNDMMIYAIKEAGAHGKPYWAYVRKILQRWQSEHITTLEQAKLNERKPTQSAQAQTKGDMNYLQHEYKASDFDDRNEDLERLYGGQ